MRVATLSGGQRIVMLSDHSAIDAADRMRSDFVANASHELRTPLPAILGYVETLQDMTRDADPPPRSPSMSHIHRSAARSPPLVTDLPSIPPAEADPFPPPPTHTP